MQLKRFIALLCVAVLIMSAAIVPVSATETESFEVGVEVGTDTPISTNPMIVKAGDKVSVRIDATNNPGIAYLAFVLNFNTDAFELESSVDSKLFGNVSRVVNGTDSIMYLVITNHGDVVNEEGTLFEATFVSKVDFDGEAEFSAELFMNSEGNCSSGNSVPVSFVGANAALELHDIVEEGVVTAPTCTEEGYTTYTCTKHEEVVIGNITEAAGHVPGRCVVEDVVDATCTETGSYNEVTYCDVCHIVLETVNVVTPAFGHTLTQVEAQAPTCTEIGWDAYEFCSVCDYTTYAEIPATGHTLTDYDGQEVTCTEIGWDAYQTCDVCGYTTYVEIPATGHTPGRCVVENVVAATCTETGSYDEVTYCDVCHVVINTVNVVVPAHGHTLINHEAQAATCTEIGWDVYETCDVCDYTTYAEIPAAGHVSGDAVVENVVDATCTETGSYDEVTYCEVCNVVLETVNVVTPVLGHSAADAVAENVVDATCTSAGSYDSVVYCAVCSTELSRDTLEVAMLPHTPGRCVVENVVDATCTETGSYDEVTYCDVCRQVIDTVNVVVPAHGHTYVDHDAQAATCTELGWDAYQTCEKCDYSTYAEVPATGHTPGKCVVENVVDATCTETGSYDEVTYCDVCREVINTVNVVVPELGHNPAEAVAENVVEATCTEAGSYDSVVYCSVCAIELSREAVVVDALGHTYVDHEAVAATCTEIGWEAYQTCEACDYSTYVEIAALGHTAGGKWTVTVEPTYEAEGERVRYCSVCNEIAVTEVMPIVNKLPFEDVKAGAWYEKGIEYCYNKGYITGVTATTFCPNNNLTREQFVLMLSRLAGADLTEYADKTTPFTDVKSGAWYASAVAWAYENKYSSGTSDTTFGIGNNITREQLSRFFYVYAEANGYDVSGRADLASFIDAGSISEWALTPVQWAVDAGLISGMTETTIVPRGNATRAQAARMFMVFDEFRNV